MKKLVSLALAGICALAFAAVADAGTAVRMKAPSRVQGTTKTTGYGEVNINYVQTRFNITKNGKLNNYDYSRGVYINGDVKGYTVDDNPDATSMGEYLNCGGKYEVRSLFTDNLLSSQRVYDDLRESLASEYARMIPAVAGEISSIHTAVETYGNGRVYSGEKIVANAGSQYSSTYNIAYQVIPGRIATLANGDGQIEESSVQGKRTNNNNTVAGDNAARSAAANNRSANAQATAVTDNDGAFVQAVKNSFANAIFTTSVASDFKNQLKAAYDQDLAAFNAQETANYNATVAEKARLQAELDQFIADYNAAVQAKATALTALNTAKANTEAKQTAYNSAVNARQVAETALSNAQTAEANALTAYNNAVIDKNAKQTTYNSAVSDREKAEKALKSAKTVEANALKELNVAKAEQETAQTAYNQAKAAFDRFDYGMREEALADALDTAREEYDDAHIAVADAKEAQTEAQKEVTSIQDKIDVASEYMTLWNAYAGVRNSHANIGETGIEQLEAVREKAEAVRAFEEEHGLAHSYMLIDGSSHNVSVIMYGDDYPSKTYSYPSKSSNIAPFLGHPDTSELESQLSSANSTVAQAKEAVTAAEKAEATAKAAYEVAETAYKDGIKELDKEQKDIKDAKDSAKDALDKANSDVVTAQADYNAKVEVREAKEDELAVAKSAEADAFTALNNAKDKVTEKDSIYKAKVKARKAKEVELADAQKAEADALTALNNAKEAQKLAQANYDAKASALAELGTIAQKKNQLRDSLNDFISGLTDYLGKNHSQEAGSTFANVAYTKATYPAYEEPDLDVLGGSNEEIVSVNSVTSIKIDAPTYTMVDGVLTETSTVNSDLYNTTVYIKSARKTISPLVLDIAGNGQLQASNGQNMPGHDVVETGNVIGDFFGDGFEIAMEWVGPQDGLLVAPKADGSVDMSCLFGTAGGYETGYEKLSLYDKNEDMKVTGEELNGLSIWQDANGNGIAEANEVKTVNSLGITSINLAFDRTNYISSFERNGQTYKMWDWWPNAVELIKVASK